METAIELALKRLDVDIDRLTLINPTVRAAMMEHKHGLPLEYALKLAVLSLAKQNDALQENLTKELQWSCRPRLTPMER
jgi:hypothetical protein